jgi:hypothetical protein
VFSDGIESCVVRALRGLIRSKQKWKGRDLTPPMSIND